MGYWLTNGLCLRKVNDHFDDRGFRVNVILAVALGLREACKGPILSITRTERLRIDVHWPGKGQGSGRTSQNKERAETRRFHVKWFPPAPVRLLIVSSNFRLKFGPFFCRWKKAAVKNAYALLGKQVRGEFWFCFRATSQSAPLCSATSTRQHFSSWRATQRAVFLFFASTPKTFSCPLLLPDC